MSTTTLDPAAAITAARDELLAELRQVLAGAGDVNQVDGLLDRITAALKSARGKVGRARKRAAAAAETKSEPARPVPAPRPAVQPARVIPAPATRPTATVPTTPRKTPAVEPAKTTPERTTRDDRPDRPADRPQPQPVHPRPARRAANGRRPGLPDDRDHQLRRRRRHEVHGLLTVAPAPRWLLPLLLVAAVLLIAFPLVAGWTGLAISSAMTGAAWLVRSRWADLLPTFKPRKSS